MHRTAWFKLGTTDLARKHGRDVEFASSFAFNYIPTVTQLLRVAFYDATSKKVERHRLIGIAQCRVYSVFAARGKPLSFPLRFLPLSDKDTKRSSKIPEGTLVVAAEQLVTTPEKFRLDVECNRILRAKSLAISSVKRVFYTIHAIFDLDPRSDKWTLIFRSGTVEMIHRKRDGGSLEYNYFSSRRLIAAPGVIIEDKDAKARERADRVARGESVTRTSSTGLLGQVRNAMGIRQKERFFSLPGADISIVDPSTRLKLSLYEDNGVSAGYELIADTAFCVKDLQSWKLGQSSPIRVHASTVGKAALKYIECGQDPRYFCLSLMMQSMR